MENKRRFTFADILLLTLAILPLVAGIVLQVLTKDPTGDITITGARVFFTVKMPLQDWPVTESQINSWLVMLTIFFLCLFLGLIGAHKFYEGKIGMGVLYIFTGGLFGIGAFVDLIVILCKPGPYYYV